MRRSFRTRPILNAESQGFTLGWYAAPRWGTGMKMLCGVPSERVRFCVPSPRVLPWAGMRCLVGARERRRYAAFLQNAPILYA